MTRIIKGEIMNSKSLLKRFLPFAAALVLGLFVASFFVTITAPSFNFKRSYKVRKYREIRNLRFENQRLREELRQQRLRTAQIEMNRNVEFERDFNNLVPPPAPLRSIK